MSIHTIYLMEGHANNLISQRTLFTNLSLHFEKPEFSSCSRTAFSALNNRSASVKGALSYENPSNMITKNLLSLFDLDPGDYIGELAMVDSIEIDNQPTPFLSIDSMLRCIRFRPTSLRNPNIAAFSLIFGLSLLSPTIASLWEQLTLYTSCLL